MGFVLVLSGASVAFGQTGNPTDNAPEGVSSFAVKQMKDGQTFSAEETAARMGVNYTPVNKTQPHHVSAGAVAGRPVVQTSAPQPQVIYVNPPQDRVATTRSSNLNTFVEGSGFANGNSPDANRTGLELVQLNNEAVREDHNHVENMTNIAVRHEENRMENSGHTLSTVFNFVNDQKMIKNEEKRREAYDSQNQREQNRRGLETLSNLADDALRRQIIRRQGN